MTNGDEIAKRLADAEQARSERRTLRERLTGLEQDLAVATRAVAEARARLEDERADVAKLESFSPTRILAGLKGERVERLEREKAEQQQAEYATATAEARESQLEAECADVRQRLQGLGDVEENWQRVLAEKEAWIPTVDPQVGASLADLATRVGALRNEERELAEADQAGQQAFRALNEAAELLGSAQSWSTYDTFFGGGLISDLQKHQRLDDATNRLRAADGALRRLATELNDVGVAPVGDVGISDLTKTFDVWFDNFFSDLAVRDRIVDSTARVRGALAAVAGVGQEIERRRAAVTQGLAQCATERESMLGA
ncbi:MULTISPECIES: hypothetical protein [unclassified Nocardioides]|uniref:hypothetical protein n=1 Tax=unclassified Nocardioides TaxID=2615069 RepID=UPI0006FE78DD|nr:MULTISPECIES: hypothetical protein [unclassified Nocardioides]KQY64713.1 hypothetical protein ASD30_07400 [Nocardioides sp. Root140]KRF12615.1 hypothetical protein ASH02_13755 [Nocardioides sp. Soil796]